MAGITEGVTAGELPVAANALPATAPLFHGVADSATAASAKLWAPRSLAAGDGLAYKFVPGMGLYLKNAGGTADGAQAAPAAGGAFGTTGALAVAPLVYDVGGATYRPVRAANGSGDGLGGSAFPGGAPWLFNETNWDRQRSNTTATLLASAARTASTVTAALVNFNGRGIHLDLAVTAKAAATTLTVQLINAGNAVIATSAALAATAGQTYSVAFYPGVVAADYTGNGSGKSVVLPRSFSIQILHSDANSVTYSLVGQTIL